MCNGVLSLITPQPKMFLGADGLPLPETPPLIEIPPLLCDSDTHTVPPGGFKKREEALPLCQQGHHFIEVHGLPALQGADPVALWNPAWARCQLFSHTSQLGSMKLMLALQHFFLWAACLC